MRVVLILMTALLLLGCTSQECMGLSDTPHGGYRGAYEPSEQDECLFGLALERGDVSICAEINWTGSDYQSRCVSEIAISKGDPSLCDGSAYCRTNYAVRTSDYPVCDGIEDGRIDCYHSVVYENTGWVNDSEGNVVKDQSQALGLCEGITDETIREDCLDWVSGWFENSSED